MSQLVQIVPFKLKNSLKGFEELNQFIKDLQLIEESVILNIEFVEDYAMILCRREIKIEGFENVESSISR